jgi:hypothetical protein
VEVQPIGWRVVARAAPRHGADLGAYGINTLGGASVSQATAVSDNGTVVGWYSGANMERPLEGSGRQLRAD